MRFYDPGAAKPEPINSLELFPDLSPEEGALECLRLGLLPSVTTVLGTLREEWLERFKASQAVKNYRMHGNAWKAVEELYSSDSKESSFGTQVHDAVHKYVTGKGHEKGQVWSHAVPAVAWIERNVKEVIISEKTLCDKGAGVAGTVDLILLMKNGQRAIGDMKVVKRRKNWPLRTPLGYQLQLEAYRRMWDIENALEYRRISLYLNSPFGDQEHNLPGLTPIEYEGDQWGLFQSCRSLWEATLANHEGTEETFEGAGRAL